LKVPSVVLIGNGTAAVRVLHALRDVGCEVPLVLADPGDRGKDTWRESLVRHARELGYQDGATLLQPDNPNDPLICQRVAEVNADLLLSVQCRRLLAPPLVTIPKRGAVNLHHAPLPLLRGCDPFAWAIHDGLLFMGVTLHRVEAVGVDDGPIYATRRWPIRDDTTAWDLYQRALEEDVALAQESLPAIASGNLAAVPQDPRYVTYHPKGQFPFEDLEVRWTQPARALSAWIRARIFPPLQVPYFQFRGVRIEVLRCRATVGRAPAGHVLRTAPLEIAAADGAIELIEVRWNGQTLSGAEWAHTVELAPGHSLAEEGSLGPEAR
jgi:methionyl-tRNA formyltransferase